MTPGRETVLLACLPELGYALARGVSGFVVATSANLAGSPPALDMMDVHIFAQRAGDQIDAIIEGRISPWNRPTTIVDTCVSPPLIVRKGIVDEQAIRKVLPDGRVKNGGVKLDTARLEQM